MQRSIARLLGLTLLVVSLSLLTAIPAHGGQAYGVAVPDTPRLTITSADATGVSFRIDMDALCAHTDDNMPDYFNWYWVNAQGAQSDHSQIQNQEASYQDGRTQFCANPITAGVNSPASGISLIFVQACNSQANFLQPCSAWASVPAIKWTTLDNNPATAQIVADGDKLYQRWSGGQIWQYTGTGAACTASPCPGWTQLDSNQSTVDIAAGGGHLYQRWSSGQIWQYTGTPCQAQGTTCTGWQQLDKNAGTAQIVADGDKLYQRWSGGQVWQYTGAPCQGQGQALTCAGWQQIDNDPNTAQLAAAGGHLYQRWSAGDIWWYKGTPCQGQGTAMTCSGWQQLRAAPLGPSTTSSTPTIAAGANNVYELGSGTVASYILLFGS